LNLSVEHACTFGWPENQVAIHSPVFLAHATLTGVVDFNHEFTGGAVTGAVTCVVNSAGIGIVAFYALSCGHAITTASVFTANFVRPAGIEHIIGTRRARCGAKCTGTIAFAGVRGAWVVVVAMGIRLASSAV
jgi:hypothetical protein